MATGCLIFTLNSLAIGDQSKVSLEILKVTLPENTL